MSTRRNRFLWRSFRAFIYSLVFTILVATALFFLIGPSYDASTVFGPSDYAVHRSVNAGNEAGQQPVLTNADRLEEVRRIAYGASSQQNVSKALYHLAYASILRQELRIDEIDTTDGVNYDVVKKAVEHRINELQPGIDARTWRPRVEYREGADAEEEDARIQEIQSRTSIPLGLWAEFVYLDLTLDHHNLSRDLLRPDRLPRTVTSLAWRVYPEIRSARDIVLNVRHRDPRMAEVLANAITATYKHQYDSDHVDGALKQLQFYRQRQLEAGRQYAMARSALTEWRTRNGGLNTVSQFDAVLKEQQAAKDDLRAIMAELRDLDAQIAATKARLAKTPKTVEHTAQVPDPEIAGLREKIAEIQIDLADKRGYQEEVNPEIQLLKERLYSVNRRIKQVSGRTVTQRAVTENEDWKELDREVAFEQKVRAGKAARIAVAQQVLAESAQLVARVPKASVEGQALASAVASSGEALSDATRKFRDAEEDFRKADETGALMVSVWAGTPPGTRDHLESPARLGGTKPRTVLLTFVFLLGLVGNLGFSYGLGALKRGISEARSEMDDVAEEELTAAQREGENNF